MTPTSTTTTTTTTRWARLALNTSSATDSTPTIATEPRDSAGTQRDPRTGRLRRGLAAVAAVVALAVGASAALALPASASTYTVGPPKMMCYGQDRLAIDLPPLVADGYRDQAFPQVLRWTSAGWRDYAVGALLHNGADAIGVYSYFQSWYLPDGRVAPGRGWDFYVPTGTVVAVRMWWRDGATGSWFNTLAYNVGHLGGAYVGTPTMCRAGQYPGGRPLWG